MNNAEVLCHSSGPWKKHKYFQKIGEGANAVYKYARKNITGSYYKDRVLDKDEESMEDLDKMDEGTRNGDKEWNYRMDSRGYQKYAHDVKARDEAEKAYYNRSLAGKIEKNVAKAKGREYWLDPLQLKGKRAEKEARAAKVQKAKTIAKEKVDRGQKLIDKLFGKGTEKKTITDTKTGKQRTPSKPKNESDTINIKQISDKNKRKR